MSDLNLKHEELNDWIKVLEEDNQNLFDSVLRMITGIRNLDESKYSGNHKKQIDIKLIPYLKKVEDSLLGSLNECTDLLKAANTKYEETDTELKNGLNQVHE